MIVAVKHFPQPTATDTTPMQMGCPVRATPQDWEAMLEKFATKIRDVLDARVVKPVSFVLLDLVGIYSSDSMFSFDARMSDDGREYVVSYAVRPIVVHPKELLQHDVRVPGSYSEVNQELVRVLHSQFMATQNIHWFWRLHTIRAEQVIAGQNYRVALVFRRD